MLELALLLRLSAEEEREQFLNGSQTQIGHEQ